MCRSSARLAGRAFLWAVAANQICCPVVPVSNVVPRQFISAGCLLTLQRLRSFDLRLILAGWLSLLVYGVLAAPIPAVNEPHYLCKAKHFWQPDWCARDFFLASPNAHTVFYVSIGWLTRWLSFEQTAWIGRALATLALASGWTSCRTTRRPRTTSTLRGATIVAREAALSDLSNRWRGPASPAPGAFCPPRP